MDCSGRIKYGIVQAKLNKTKFTTKQFPTKIRFYKSPNKWSDSQKERAVILFKEYPEIKSVYILSQKNCVVSTLII